MYAGRCYGTLSRWLASRTPSLPLRVGFPAEAQAHCEGNPNRALVPGTVFEDRIWLKRKCVYFRSRAQIDSVAGDHWSQEKFLLREGLTVLFSLRCLKSHRDIDKWGGPFTLRQRADFVLCYTKNFATHGRVYLYRI